MLIPNNPNKNTRQEPAGQAKQASAFDISISPTRDLTFAITPGPDWDRMKLPCLEIGPADPRITKCMRIKCGQQTIDSFNFNSFDSALVNSVVVGTALAHTLGECLNTKYRTRSISHADSVKLANEITKGAPVILAVGKEALYQCALAAHRLSLKNQNPTNIKILFAPDAHGAIELIRIGNRHLIAPVTVATILEAGTVSSGYFNHKISPSLIIAEPTICKQLETLGLPVFQSSLITDQFPAHDKFKQYQTLHEQGFPFPETILVRRSHLKQGDLVDAATLLRRKECLIKPTNAAQSRGVVIIDPNLEHSKKRACLRNALTRYPEVVLQEYVKNYPTAESVGFSTWNLRVLVTPSGMIDLEIRAGEIGGVVAISQGSKALEWCAESLFGKKPTPTQRAAFEQMDCELKKLVHDFIKKNPNNLGLVGLDIIITPECKPVIIEVNTGAVGGLSTLVKLRHKLSDDQIFAGIDRQLASYREAFASPQQNSYCPSDIMHYQGCISSLDADPKLAFLEWPSITHGIESEELGLILQMAALAKFKDCQNVSEISRHDFVRDLVRSPDYTVFRHVFGLIMQQELPFDGSAAEIILQKLANSNDCDNFARLCIKNKELLPQDLIAILVYYRNLRRTGESNEVIAMLRAEIHTRLGDNFNSVMNKFPKELRFAAEKALGRTWQALPYLAHGLFSKDRFERATCADALGIFRLPLLLMNSFQVLTLGQISEFATRYMQEGDETSARELQKQYGLPITTSDYFLAGRSEPLDRLNDGLVIILSNIIDAVSRAIPKKLR